MHTTVVVCRMGVWACLVCVSDVGIYLPCGGVRGFTDQKMVDVA